MDEERTYRLRWMNTSPELLADLVALEALDRDKALAMKRRAVTQLGIEIQEGETPYDAWLRILCEINQLPNVRPVDPGLAAAILDDPEVARFNFAVA